MGQIHFVLVADDFFWRGDEKRGIKRLGIGLLKHLARYWHVSWMEFVVQCGRVGLIQHLIAVLVVVYSCLYICFNQKFYILVN